LVGMVVDSLCNVLGRGIASCALDRHLHKVVLEEVLQLPLGGRISEVSNVKSPTLGGAGTDSLVVGCGGLLGAGVLRGRSGVVKGGVGHLGGDLFDWGGHVC
jgi:hypothetical protein